MYTDSSVCLDTKAKVGVPFCDWLVNLHYQWWLRVVCFAEELCTADAFPLQLFAGLLLFPLESPSPMSLAFPLSEPRVSACLFKWHINSLKMMNEYEWHGHVYRLNSPEVFESCKLDSTRTSCAYFASCNWIPDWVEGPSHFFWPCGQVCVLPSIAKTNDSSQVSSDSLDQSFPRTLASKFRK